MEGYNHREAPQKSSTVSIPVIAGKKAAKTVLDRHGAKRLALFSVY